MNETEISVEKITKKVNCESYSKNFEVKSADFNTYFPKPKNISDLVCIRKIKTSAHKQQNEDDMLQANQANLKCSTGYANNLKQVININSSIHERYRKLQKISLHHLLNKGEYMRLV